MYGLRRDGCGILLRTCGIHLCTCGLLLCTYRIVLCTCGIHLYTYGVLLCTCRNYLCTGGIHLCTCRNYLCTCGLLLCTCGNHLCTCRNYLCTWGILLCTCRNYLCTCGILLCTCGILLCKNAADGGAKGSVEYAPAHPVVLKSKKSGVPETHAGQGLPHAHGFQHQIAAQPSKGALRTNPRQLHPDNDQGDRLSETQGRSPRPRQRQPKDTESADQKKRATCRS